MNKLHQVFEFLKSNHHWNEEFQIAEYRRTLAHCRTPKARICALLHLIAHTQPSPDLEALSNFWKHIEAAPWDDRMPGLGELSEYISKLSKLPNFSREPWERLFRSLMNVPGWGPKTSALFVKCVIKLHRSKCDDSHFLEEADAAEIFGKDDRVFLPVDAVIKRISQAIPAAGLGTSFDSMNARLCAAGFIAEDMLVWDDLWFWGFLTQNSSTKERVMAWNEPRFWGQLSMPKSKIDEIKRECETFLALLVP